MNVKSSVTTAALAAAGVVLSAGAAHASAPRISSHEQLQASITAAVAAMTPHELTAATGNPAGMPQAAVTPIGKQA